MTVHRPSKISENQINRVREQLQVEREFLRRMPSGTPNSTMEET
jgi:hypothetical protein